MARGAPLLVLPRGAFFPWLALNVPPVPPPMPGRTAAPYRPLGYLVLAIPCHLLSFFDVFELGCWDFGRQAVV